MERLTKRLQSGAADYAVNMAGLTHPNRCMYRQKCVERLAAYEDTGLEPEEIAALVKARDEGRVVMLPEVSERDRQSMADYLHDCFAEWIDDPSVGLNGMTEGEAELANAIMDALTRAEAEAALNGGGGDGV